MTTTPETAPVEATTASKTFLTNQEIIQAAHQNLGKGQWDNLVGGSESETTMRRNRLGFDRLAFRPRILVDVSHIDTSTTLLGHRLRIPIILAPMGSLQELTPAGAIAATRAAAEFGSLHVISSVTQPSLEETAASVDYPKIYQLYVTNRWDWVKETLTRVKSSGYWGFCLTVDTAHYSRRERPMMSHYLTPNRRTPPDPKWRASLTWEMMDRIKDFVDLRFMLKGVATAEDAAIAVEHGVNVIWVSNHGGRQLDHGRATIDILPEIVQAVNGRAQIVLDGGIQRGSDVVKSIALGADAVAIGKLQGWGLGADGQAGMLRVLEILEDEIHVAMGLLGVTAMDQLSNAYLCRDEPVMWPHEMSQFSNLTDGPLR